MNWKEIAAKDNPRIEYDVPTDRMYITLACGYEFQTKGNDRTTPCLVCPDGERYPILTDGDIALEHLEACMFDQAANLNYRDSQIAELTARVQLLAKALREAREEALYWFKNANPKLLNQDREPAGWVRVIDNIDAALAEAGLQETDMDAK